MKWLPGILAFCMAPAFADPSSPADNMTCPYPASALTAKAEGTTLVGFVPTNGSLRNVTVRHSSGNPNLDQAAVTCASGWRFDPKNDKDRAWVDYKGAYIYWSQSSGPGGKPAGLRLGRPHNCGWAYPAQAREQKPTGTTALRFVITDDGHVRDARLVTSSGNSKLDEAALACVRHWKYLPAVKNNKNVEVRWYVEIPWTPDDALVTVERTDQ